MYTLALCLWSLCKLLYAHLRARKHSYISRSYDGLIGMFSSNEVPAVGVSIGIERVFALIEASTRARAVAAGGRVRDTYVKVCALLFCARETHA